MTQISQNRKDTLVNKEREKFRFYVYHQEHPQAILFIFRLGPFPSMSDVAIDHLGRKWERESQERMLSSEQSSLSPFESEKRPN